MTQDESTHEVDIDAHLHLESGIAGDERALVISSLQPLTRLLTPLDRESLRIEAWVKDRGARGQLTYVSVRAKDTDVVAEDDSTDFDAALIGVRRDLKRQLTDLLDRRANHRG